MAANLLLRSKPGIKTFWSFHVVSKREGKGSIVITSNRGFRDWDSIFSDPLVVTAIVDRLLHNAVVINIRGDSYRMRHIATSGPDGRGFGHSRGKTSL